MQWLMEHDLVDLHWSTSLYLDDIIILSRTVAEHLGKLRIEVFSHLKIAQ